jgi:glycosyltransferase involved in cell wall biosynthesis
MNAKNGYTNTKDPVQKVLFVTRKYPPSVGGMQKYSHDFYVSMKKIIDVDLVANKKNKLLLFWIRATIFILIKSKNYSIIHFGDAVLAPLAIFSKIVARAKVTLTVHALDITYRSSLYQAIIPWCVARCDKVICVSNYTIDECVKRGVPRNKCVFIPNGIIFQKHVTFNKKETFEKLGINVNGKKVLLSVGRLIKRKGNEWFVNEVMPLLSSKFVYLIVGEGSEKEKIQSTVEKHGLANRVFLLGRQSKKMVHSLYKNSDLFIMPNIEVKGDAEGFGIVLIEAASFGLPSVASDIEGIKDSVIEGETGWLVKEREKECFLEKISRDNQNLEIGESFKKFEWKKISKQYHQLFIDLNVDGHNNLQS